MPNDTKAILWLAVEDYGGLWEAIWELRSIRPDADYDFLLDRARSVLSDLIAQGLVELLHCRESTDDCWPIAEDSAYKLLAQAENWLEPSSLDDILIRFSATPAGDAEVLSRDSTGVNS